MSIKTRPQYAWRKKYRQAFFRTATFLVEADMQASGRRVALHQYPKRNTPYAEDMGRSARQYKVQGYLIGPTYLDDKDTLITALEADGPGILRLPMPYAGADVTVMVGQYSVMQMRERGGFCAFDMEFVEYGSPVWRTNVSTVAVIQKSANAVEQAVAGPGQPTATTAKQAALFATIFNNTGGLK